MSPIGIKVFTLTLLIIAMAIFVTSTPYSWGNYDASLDPIVWSRGFVKDSIRRPRLYRSNTVDDDRDGEDDMRLSLKQSDVASHSSKGNYGDFRSARYIAEPSSRKLNTMRRKFYRRLQKLDARDRYGFV